MRTTRHNNLALVLFAESVVLLKIALVGCGAISQMFYVPALKLVPEHVIEWFVDSNIERARQAAKAYGQGNVARNHEEVICKVDAAIVAVPNYLHARISTDFLAKERHVLCEKPLATNFDEGLAMVRAGERSGARLAVSLIRRRFDSYRLGRSVLHRGIIGDVTSVSIEEGDLLSWPFVSLFMLEKEKAGGGVLIDLGSHVLDILHWFFPGRFTVLSYEDDGLGRVEADCEAELRIETSRKDIPCSVKLSRTRKLSNHLIIEGDKGFLEIQPYDLNRVHLSLGCTDKVELKSEKKKSQVECFAEQVIAFMDTSSRDITEGSEYLQTLRIIEQCYEKRQDMSYPWQVASRSNVATSIRSIHGKILVVGASGFVGTRLVERLALDLKASVRVAIHRPETAARLGRLPVEYAECDLLDSSQVMKCVEECDIVVNCARDRSGDSGRMLDTFVLGTRNLLEASTRHGIKKFIHLSSAAVHGFKHRTEVVDESAPLKSTLNPYVRGKIKSEKLVMSYAQRFPVVILRPTLIYGPFSSDWVGGIIERLKNQLVTQVDGNKLANLIFIDDVVDAILLAIEREEANGGVFIINDDKSRVTWGDYLREFSDITGISPRTMPDEGLFSYNARKFASLVKDSVVAAGRVLNSDEMLVLLAQIPLVVFLGERLMKGKRRVEIGARLSSGSALKYESKILQKYQRINRDFYEVLACSTVFSSSKAEATFGFRPRTPFGEGMEATREWIRWARLV